MASHVCVLCEETFPDKDSLKNHFWKHGRRSQDTAPSAAEPSSSSRPSYGPSTCEICDIKISSQTSYWKHYNYCHPEWRGIDCEHCGTHFHHYKEYLRHCDERHLIERPPQSIDDVDDVERLQLQCPVCPAQFLNRGALRHHVVIHEKVWKAGHKMEYSQPAYNSTLCKTIKSATKAGQRSSLSQQQQEDAFRLNATFCKACQCRFANGTALAQHLITHGLFLCLECGDEMDSDDQFVRHQEVHFSRTTPLID